MSQRKMIIDQFPSARVDADKADPGGNEFEMLGHIRFILYCFSNSPYVERHEGVVLRFGFRSPCRRIFLKNLPQPIKPLGRCVTTAGNLLNNCAIMPALFYQYFCLETRPLVFFVKAKRYRKQKGHGW
jgi:hypothetical protein